MPERTRLLRPSLWADAATATLSAEAFRLYIGLAMLSDDAGMLLWRPATIAAYVYRYWAPTRRERLFAKVAAELIAAGLLETMECRCAFMPFLARDFRVSGGNQATTIETYHLGHVPPDAADDDHPTDKSGLIHTNADKSRSGSVSASASGSGSGSVRHDDPSRTDERPTTAQPCVGCGKPIDLHHDDGVRQTPDGPVHDYPCRDALAAGARRADR